MRRVTAAALLVVLIGCSDGDDAEEAVGDPTTTVSETTTTEWSTAEGAALGRVRNAAAVASEEEELVEHLLQDPWVAEIEGPLEVEVEHGGGHSFVTFEYEASHNINEFRFDHDGCGLQPDVVTGVRFLVVPGNARAGAAWAAKGFTWRSESGEAVSCVRAPQSGAR